MDSISHYQEEGGNEEALPRNEFVADFFGSAVFSTTQAKLP
jgi:hypothetical protein